jgi:peptidoglycan/LPS O-acetylase OafA/YrhL
MDSKPTYLPYVDGLRALAVVAVVVYHLHAAWLPGGFAGVDVFFVISGFIVSASVGNLERFGLHRFLPFFYARRLVRIAPALIVMLMVSTYVSALIVPAAWLSQSNQTTGLYAFFGLSNLILARTSNDYFSPLVDFNPFTHTWSLGVEEQFYLIFPLLFFAWSYRGRWRMLVTALFSAALVASLMVAAYLDQTDKTSAYYLITSRFWQLASGVLLYHGMVYAGRRFDQREQPSPRWFGMAAWASATLLVYGLITGNPSRFPYPGSLPVVIGSLGMLGFLHGKSPSNMLVRILSQRSVLFVGRISYSLYLWHWPIFVFFRWTVGLDTLWKQVLAVAISFGFATLSYRYVEGPIRRIRFIKAMPRIAVTAMGVLVIGTAAWSASAINNAQADISRTRVQRHAADWYPSAPDTDPSMPGCAIADGGGKGSMGQFMTFSRFGCASPAIAPNIFAIGDSHALAFVGLYKRYSLQTGASVTLYINGGCPFLSLKASEDTPICRASAQASLADILTKVKPGDVLFLPSLRLPRFVDQYVRYDDSVVYGQIFSEQAVHERDNAVAKGKAILDEFVAKGVHVVLEAPMPVFKSPTFRCAERYNKLNPICRDGSKVQRDELERLRQPIVTSLNELAKTSPSDVRVWDPFPVLCPHPTCYALDGKRPLFFDADHVSGYGNSLLVPSFIQFVQQFATRPASAQVMAPPLAGGG